MPAQKFRTQLKTTGLVWDELFTAAVSFAGSPAYKWVAPGSIYGEVIPATGASLPAPIGIAQNNPAATGLVRVRVMGKSITSACLGACNLIQGTYITVASGGQTTPSVCGLATARWAGSNVLSTASAAYGEVYLLGPSFNTCVAGAS